MDALLLPPQPEVCDGIDNDCDGSADEDLGTTTCGVGACQATVQSCVNGQIQICNPPLNGGPDGEVCDGIDNDCDGLVDEDLAPRTCSTACGAGTETCQDGKWSGCTAPVPQPEVCDGIDNNCDGAVDEDLAPRTCSTACGSGTETCQDGKWSGCTAPVPQPEVCDGADNNCDGATDEGFNLQTDPQNCGFCGKVCSYPHASALCASGSCQIGSCDPGWQDKDGNPANGCEGCSPWQAMIVATGQEAGSAIRVSNVILGGSSSPYTLLAPSAPPEYTVQMRIKGKTLNQYHGADIRSCSSQYEYWILRVQVNNEAADASQPGYYPLLSWNPDQFSFDTGSHYSLYLGTQGKGTLLVPDMRETTSYQIKQGDGEYFSIVLSKGLWSVDLSLNEGWNLISLPVEPANPIVADLFPDAAVIYEFNPSYGYVPLSSDSTMEVGRGYWIYTLAARNYQTYGQKVTSHSEDLTQGWSLIGGISCPCTVQALSGNIMAIYNFDPSYGYIPINQTQNFTPGLGYWINLSQPAMIEMECPDSTPSGQTPSSGQPTYSGHSALTSRTLDTWSLDTWSLPTEISAPHADAPHAAVHGTAWETLILVTGQEAESPVKEAESTAREVESAVRVSNVIIGQDDDPLQLLSPGVPPEYTVRAQVKDPDRNQYYGKDIRRLDSGSEKWVEKWVIKVQINDETADITADIAVQGYYPVISWDRATLGGGKFELRRGASGDGELLADMKATHFYQTTDKDGGTTQWFSIVWTEHP